MHKFLTLLVALGMTAPPICGSLSAQNTARQAKGRGETPKKFRVWVFADAHVGTDKKHGRESLAEAIRQSESASGFEWDIALDLGDMSGEQGTPKDPEGGDRPPIRRAEAAPPRGHLRPIRAITTAVVSMNRRPGGGANGSTPPASTQIFRMLTRRSARFQSRARGSDTRFASAISFS